MKLNHKAKQYAEAMFYVASESDSEMEIIGELSESHNHREIIGR